MGNRFLFYFVCLAITFTSCKGNEDKEEVRNEGIDSSQLVGEWYQKYGDYIEDINFSQNYRFTGIVYTNLTSTLTIADNLSGMWGLSSYGTVLQMDIYRTSTGFSNIKNYDVVKGDGYSLQLIDKEYNSTVSYQKIIESEKIRKDETFEISLSASKYSSSNESIAKVDDNGHVTAIGSGIAFISLSTKMGTLIVKVEVQ